MAKAVPASAAEPKRQDVDAPAAVGEPLAVPIEHGHVREKVMGEEHRLGPLQVRVAGHGRLAVLLRLLEQSRLHRGERGVELAEHLADVQALVEGDLIVAGAPGVQLAAHRAGQLDQPALDIHVDVFELRAEREAPALELGPHGVESLLDGPALRRVDQARPLERSRPRRRCRECREARAAGRRTARR